MIFKPFRIADKNKLFQDYLENFEKLKSFYDHSYVADWNSVLEKRQKFKFPRQELYQILMDQNLHWNAPFPALENIKKIRETNTFAVVTGQQAGVFGGPLYTIYKSMTVLKLAEFLNKEYPEYQFVPVFWMEVDDNDFQEINNIQYIDKENQIQKLQLKERSFETLQPVFMRKISAEIRSWKAKLQQDFFDTEFKQEVLDTFFEIYRPGETYENAFARLLLKLLGSRGLVILNPVVFPVKKLVKGLFRRALLQAEEIYRTIYEQNRLLEKSGYHSQIHLKHNQTLLFFLDDTSRRVRIDKENGEYFLAAPDGVRGIDADALLQMVDFESERFSPNVALRPLIQDSLLPTVAYVAGPAEVAYFAQLSSLYHFFEMPMPVIYPRHRITIVEKKIKRLIDKLQLNYEEILEKKSTLIEYYLTQKNDVPLLEEIERFKELFRDKFKELAPLVQDFDPTLLHSLQQTESSFEKSLGKLQNKILRSFETKEKTIVNQLEKIVLHLFPHNNYQEREFNIIYFLIKYGWGYLTEVMENLPEDTQPHYFGELE